MCTFTSYNAIINKRSGTCIVYTIIMTEFIDFIGYNRAQPAVLNSNDCITDKKIYQIQW